MKILFLPNWQVHKIDTDTEKYQAPDKYVKGQPYWFFKYFPDDTEVDVIDIHKDNWIGWLEKKLKFYIIQGFIAYRKENNYDVVVSHGAQSGVLLALLRRLFGKGRAKHVIFDIGGMNGARTVGFSTRLIQFAMKSDPYIICHSTNILRNLEVTYPWLRDRAIFIPFGIGLYQYSLREIGEYKKEIFVFSGAKRDEETVYRAWESIVRNGENEGYTLSFVGTKQHYDLENTHSIARLKYDDYIEKLGSSAFVILPLFEYSYSYGQMSLLGAMALGKRMIVSNVGGISDYLEHCISAIKVVTENVEEMKKGILHCIHNPMNPEERDSIRQEIGKYYDEETMARRIYDFINQLS